MVTPYITFAGNCQEAIEFYKEVFNSTIKMVQSYGDYVPEGIVEPPDDLDTWILHAEMEICGTNFWFADEVAEPVNAGNTESPWLQSGKTMVKLTVQVPGAEEAQRIFDALNREAYITLPPVETFYSAFHAALMDRFGVGWNITAV